MRFTVEDGRVRDRIYLRRPSRPWFGGPTVRGRLEKFLVSLRRSALRREDSIYEQIYESPFFDHELYLAENQDVPRHPRNAWAHYVSFGWREGRRPSKFFDPEYYLSRYPDVRDAGVEPLKHWYLQGRFEDRWPYDPYRVETMEVPVQSGGICNALANRVVIAIPVFGAGHQVERLVQSLRENFSSLPLGTIVHLHDDGSDDEYLARVLEGLDSEQFVVTRSEANGGFTRSANLLISSHPDRDVVLLNSDCVIFRGWFEPLARAAFAAERVASATALTNRGSIASYPNWPIGDDVDIQAARLFSEQQALSGPTWGEYPMLPTAVGHCMYLKRSAISEVGLLNERLFPRGYGEENEWSLRCQQRGWVHVLAMGSYVYHEGGTSFGTERATLMKQGMDTLLAAHPDYAEGVASWLKSSDLPARLNRVRFIKSPLPETLVSLHLVHDFGGGTETMVERLVLRETAAEGATAAVVRVGNDRADVRLATVVGGELTWNAAALVPVTELGALISRLRPVTGVVDVHDPYILRLDCLAAVKTEGAAIRLWLHDARLMCALDFMVHPNGRPCSGPEPAKCDRCISMSRKSDLAGGYFGHWVRTSSIVELCDLLVAPSQSASRFFSRHLGRPVQHGFSSGEFETANRQALDGVESAHGNHSLDEPRRGGVVALVGAMVPHKGSRLLREIVEEAYLLRPEIVFVLIGAWLDPDCEAPLGLYVTGAYQGLEGLRRVAGTVDPDAYLFISPAAETYSLTAEEVVAVRSEGSRVFAPNGPVWRERFGSELDVVFYDSKATPAEILNLLAEWFAEEQDDDFSE